MSTNPDTTRRTDRTNQRTTSRPDRGSRTDRRTDREERESGAPLCPDLGPTTTPPELRRELTTIREQLDRIERRMDGTASEPTEPTESRTERTGGGR